MLVVDVVPTVATTQNGRQPSAISPRIAWTKALGMVNFAVPMSDAVTPDYLLKGAVYSLEQCGMLLRDAYLLYRIGAYASGVVLAAYAREALGQWKILLALRKEVIGGKTVTVAEIKNRCSDHVQKQKAGMLSITMRADRDSGAGRLLMSSMTAQVGTEEWKKADEELARIDQRMKRKVPTERHEQREVALYVDPIEPLSVGRWNRPSKEISKVVAQNFILDARNDYVVQSDRYTNREIMEPDLFNALEQWPDRPALPVVPLADALE
jgi:AbiV family abortive infection protein